jgi:hypothetical protein
MIQLNDLNKELVDVTTTELNEINGGGLGAAAGQLFGRVTGRSTERSNALGISGAQIGSGIGAIGGGIAGFALSTPTGFISLFSNAFF